MVDWDEKKKMKPSIEFQLRVQIGLEIACRWGLVSVCVCVDVCSQQVSISFQTQTESERETT